MRTQRLASRGRNAGTAAPDKCHNRQIELFLLDKSMELDTNKIDEAVLALLYLGLHDGARAWKGFDWDALDRLSTQGFITDPRSKAKSVVFTEEGLERAKTLLEKLFGQHTGQTTPSDQQR
jgi:hypothetical protein